MDFLDDPEEMAPEERLAELASILAAGYSRLRKSQAEHASAAGTFTAPTEKELDCPVAPMPLSDRGLTDRDPRLTEGSE